jgi:uncharacterized protein (TIGR02246 family)
MRLIVGSTVLLALLAGAACQPPEQPAPKKDTTAADVAAVNQVRDTYVSAENAGDAAAVAALYAEDAVRMPPDQPAVSGKAAIEAQLQQEYSMMTMELSVASRETKVAGDIAYDTGTHKIKLTPKAGGNAIEATGKHVVTLARQADGSWKITNLIFNTDAPMTMPSMAPVQK